MRRVLILCLVLFLVPVTHAADNKAEVADLIKQLKSKKVADRVKAAEGLSKLGPEGKEASSALVDALMEKYPVNKEDYLGALEKVNPAIYKPLVTLLVDKNRIDRLKAVEDIGKLGAEGAPCTTALILLFDAERATAEKLNAPSLFCPEIVVALVGVAPQDKRTVQLVVKAISRADPNPKTRANALQAAKKMSIEPKTLVPALMSATADRNIVVLDGMINFNIPIAAMQMLGALGKEAKAAIPTLNKLKLDSQAEIREAATEALKKIMAS
jgi:HEAT repeat protein